MLIGLDVGGTNIDAVIIQDRRIIKRVKSPLDHDLLGSILKTLDQLLGGYDKALIKRINLSTTISTNAIVKKTVSKVGMFIQSGPGLPAAFLACGDLNMFLSGSTDHRGRIVKEITKGEVEEGIALFRENKIESCAVISKFSTRNPRSEQEVAKMAKGEFDFITKGYSLSGKLNFPRRVHTSYLNSAVYQTFNEFATSIRESFKRKEIHAPVYILKADGGTMDLATAQRQPVETILSGPAASYLGSSALLPTQLDSLLLDVGGTTTDISFLVNGTCLFEPLGIEIGKYKTLIRSIYSVSIEVGGDSTCLILKTMAETIKEKVDLLLEKINAKPVYTVKEVLYGRKVDPKQIHVIGGPAKRLAPILEKVFDLPCYYPKDYPIANAIGAALAQPTMEIRLLADTQRKTVSVPELGNYEVIKGNYNLEMAKTQAIGLLKKHIKSVDPESKIQDKDIEIIEETSFNMIDGFHTRGQNIRVQAQVKPGLIFSLRSERENDES